MAHWCELDENNVVRQTIVTDNNDPNGDEGYQWIMDNLGGNWIQTSYNGNFRKQYGYPGYTYDAERDAFIPPKIFPSWTLNEDTCKWEPPTPYPTDGAVYFWEEETLNWELEPIQPEQ